MNGHPVLDVMRGEIFRVFQNLAGEDEAQVLNGSIVEFSRYCLFELKKKCVSAMMKIKKTICSTNLFHVSIIFNFHRLFLLGGLHLHCDHLVLILQLFITLKHDRSIRMKVPLWPVF